MKDYKRDTRFTLLFSKTFWIIILVIFITGYALNLFNIIEI